MRRAIVGATALVLALVAVRQAAADPPDPQEIVDAIVDRLPPVPPIADKLRLVRQLAGFVCEPFVGPERIHINGRLDDGYSFDLVVLRCPGGQTVFPRVDYNIAGSSGSSTATLYAEAFAPGASTKDFFVEGLEYVFLRFEYGGSEITFDISALNDGLDDASAGASKVVGTGACASAYSLVVHGGRLTGGTATDETGAARRITSGTITHEQLIAWANVLAGPGASCEIPGPHAPDNDDFANATTIQGSTFMDVVDTTNASLEAGEPVSYRGRPNSIDQTVWYRFVPDATGILVLRTCTSPVSDGAKTDFNTILSAYVGDDLSSLSTAPAPADATPFSANDNFCEGADLPGDTPAVGDPRASTTVVAVRPGVTYHIQLGGYVTDPCGECSSASGVARVEATFLSGDQ
jgi:hypothetical protein